MLAISFIPFTPTNTLKGFNLYVHFVTNFALFKHVIQKNAISITNEQTVISNGGTTEVTSSTIGSQKRKTRVPKTLQFTNQSSIGIFATKYLAAKFKHQPLTHNSMQSHTTKAYPICLVLLFAADKSSCTFNYSVNCHSVQL